MRRTLFAILTFVSFAPFAFADEAASSSAAAAHRGGGLSSLVMFGALFAMMYFLMIRPQSKRAKEHRNLLANLVKDDEVVTQGGMLGKIVRDSGNYFIIAIGEGVEVPVQKQSVVQMLPKGTLKTIC